MKVTDQLRPGWENGPKTCVETSWLSIQLPSKRFHNVESKREREEGKKKVSTERK